MPHVSFNAGAHRFYRCMFCRQPYFATARMFVYDGVFVCVLCVRFSRRSIWPKDVSQTYALGGARERHERLPKHNRAQNIYERLNAYTFALNSPLLWHIVASSYRRRRSRRHDGVCRARCSHADIRHVFSRIFAFDAVSM